LRFVEARLEYCKC